jgi:hypothetical protein
VRDRRTPSLATLKFVSIVFASVASCSIFAIGRRYSYVVINARAISARCELPSHWAVVNAALDASYRLAAPATGGADAYKLYERR